MKTKRKSTVVGFFLVLIGTVMVTAGWWTMPEPRPQHAETAVVPPPTHVEWDNYPVGGMILISPDEADSTGDHQVLECPPGSVLCVPHMIEGADPDSASKVI